VTVAAAEAPSPARLNPFAFPSDTGIRYILLLVSLFSASLFIYRWLFLSGHSADPFGGCVAGAFETGRIQLDDRPIDCPTVDWVSVVEAVAASAAVGALSFLLYVLMPAWKRWRAGFTPVPAEDAQEIITAVISMAHRAGLTHPPLLVWNPLNPSHSAIAFGALGRYTVGIHGGLVTRWSTDRPGFRAVILHELAHIRNGDVDKTYLTVASWWAFVLAVLLPFGAGLLRNRQSILDVGVRAAALVFLVYVIRNAVLRARESYADVRASTWDSADAALRGVIARLPSPRFPLAEVGGRHPDPRQRVRVLDDTSLLFPARPWDAFLTGVVGSVAVTNLTNTVAALTLRGQLHYDVAFVAVAVAELLGQGLLLGAFLVGVMGSGIWRVSFALLAGRPVRAGLLPLAGAVGVGLLVGHLLSFQFAGPPGGFDPLRIAVTGLWLVLCTAALAGGIYLIFRWTMASAFAWLGRIGSERALRRATWACLSLAATFAAVWLGLGVPLRDAIELLVLQVPASGMPVVVLYAPVAITGLALGVLSTPPALLLLSAALAWPVAALVRRPSPADVDWRWGFLGVWPRQAPGVPGADLGLARIVRIALVAATVYVVLLGALGLVIAGHLLPPIPPDRAQAVGVAGYIGLVGAAVLLQALAAVIVVSAGGPFAGVRGLIAAFVAGWPMAAALVLLVVRLSGLDPVLSVLTVCMVINGGGALSLLAGVLVGGLAASRRVAAADVNRFG
jgi:Zn-dependent protease with chaperone function